MKIYLKIIPCAIIVIFITNIVYAQKGSNDSLKKYIEVAEQNNPELQAKFNEYKASLENITVAGALPDPNISFGYFIQKMELVEGNEVADIKLMQMFPWFGTLKASKNEASQMAKSKYEELRNVKYRLINDIQNLYYQLYQIEQNIKLSKENIEILNTIKQLALVNFKTADLSQQKASGNMQSSYNNQQQAENMQGREGAISNQKSAISSQQSDGSMQTSSGNGGLAEILRLQLEFNEIENNIVLLKNREKALFARFNSYLNRKPESLITISDTLTADTTDLNILNIRDSILRNNPMLGMINADKQAYDAKIQMSKLMKYPMLGLGVDYTVISKRADVMSGMNGQDMIMPMVSVTLPVYRKKYNANIREATLLKKASDDMYDAAVNSLDADYIQALQDYNNGKQKLKFNKNQVVITQIAFDLIINNFSASKADMTEILRVQQQLLDYKVKSIEALVEINNALAEIKQLIAVNNE